MPLMLTTNESFLHSPVFQIPDEIAVPVLTSASSSSRVTPAGVHVAFRWRRIVCWTGLQSNRSIRIKMARDSLDRRGNSTLLLVHG